MGKRFLILIISALMVGIAGLSGCTAEPRPPAVAEPAPLPDEYPQYEAPSDGEAPNVESVVFRVSEAHTVGFPTEIGLQHFAHRVAELTNGEIIIEVHADGVLGTEPEMIEQLRDGELEMVRAPIELLYDANPDVYALAMPFLYRDREHMFAVLDGPIGDEFLESLRDGGVLGLAWFDPGARSFYFADTEVTSVEDMAGMVIRTRSVPFMWRMVEHLGATAVVVPFGEVNDAFERGEIDGAENSMLSYEATRRFAYAPHLTLTEHTRSPEIIAINSDLFDSLSSRQQAAIRTAAKEASEIQREEWLRQERRAERIAVANGAVITRLTEEQRQPFIDAMLPLYEEFAHLAEIIEAIRAH